MKAVMRRRSPQSAQTRTSTLGDAVDAAEERGPFEACGAIGIVGRIAEDGSGQSTARGLDEPDHKRGRGRERQQN